MFIQAIPCPVRDDYHCLSQDSAKRTPKALERAKGLSFTETAADPGCNAPCRSG